jgi:hypothetical protein
MGITDSRLMNACLLVKWIWRIYSGEQGLWADILRSKCLRDKDLMLDDLRPGSQFWNSIQKLKHLFRLGAKHSVCDGKTTSFWRDWWQGSGPLCDRFPTLFAVAVDQDLSVAAARTGSTWPLRR